MKPSQVCVIACLFATFFSVNSFAFKLWEIPSGYVIRLNQDFKFMPGETSQAISQDSHYKAVGNSNRSQYEVWYTYFQATPHLTCDLSVRSFSDHFREIPAGTELFIQSTAVETNSEGNSVVSIRFKSGSNSGALVCTMAKNLLAQMDHTFFNQTYGQSISLVMATAAANSGGLIAFYCNESEFGFTFPKFVRENGIEVPEDFFKFWRRYYSLSEADQQRMREENQHFREYDEKLLSIFDQVKLKLKKENGELPIGAP